MSRRPEAPAAPATKFRMPRLRRDTIERPALLLQAQTLAHQRRVLLVQAPAGFGKTTLLAQLAGVLAQGPECQVAWLSLDADDGDPNRLFAALLGALRGLALEWEIDPLLLLGSLHDDGPRSRAALGPLLDALSSYAGERAFLVLDDLHRIDDAAALRLLDHLIDRLPPEIGVLIGSRTEPALSLARWRVRGELGELLSHDLQFDRDAARALLQARGMSQRPDEWLHTALARTNGWAAGLQLLLDADPQGRPSGALAPSAAAIGAQAHRHLFDFFAQEVLAELPDDLRDFLLHCAVLAELNPALCEAVTGRADSAAVLEALYRRRLFLTTLDDTQPVLRLHDLFLDFLRSELARRHPGLVAPLHARAAAAETAAPRAVAHWLQAGRWQEALAAMQAAAEPLLATGASALIERWLAQLPADWRAGQPAAAHLAGLCAWSRWDWPRAGDHFRRAVEGYRREGHREASIVALGMLGACQNGLGDLAGARAVIDEARGLDLPAALQVPFDSLEAWSSLARGELPAIAPALERMADHVTAAPSTRYPNVADMGYGHFVGLPGTGPAMRRLQAACTEPATGLTTVPVPVLTGWQAFWHGDLAHATQALQDALWHQQRQPGALMLAMGTHHLAAQVHAARGETAAAFHAIDQVRQAQASPEAAGQRGGWQRTYLHVQARLHWMAEDATGLAALLPTLTAPRTAHEWPVLDMGAALVRGQLALLRDDLDQAEAALAEAVALHRRWRLATFFGDPRLSLAMARLARGDATAAVPLVDAVFDEAEQADAIGPLLMEPRRRLQALWSHLAPDTQAALQPLWTRWLAWQRPAAPGGADTVDAAGLTEREQEVLARLAAGDSNKLIARALDLSPHTVKRHVANLLGKLQVDSRGQAAALWHRHRG